MRVHRGTNEGQTRRTWFVLMAAFVGVVSWTLWNSARSSSAMSAAAVSDQKGAGDSAPGTKTKLVMEIGESSGEETIKGRVLKKKTEEIYTRTDSLVTVHSNDQTKIVMGKPSDIHSGAVVHVSGAVRDDRSIQAEQLVILTGYVKVE